MVFVRCGRCRLHGVEIRNKGVDWQCNSNVYWQYQVHRLESVEIILHGNAEFEAFDVVLEVRKSSTIASCLSSSPFRYISTASIMIYSYSF